VSARTAHVSGTDAPQLSARRAHILSHIKDGVGIVSTARSALERGDTTAFAVTGLRFGIDMLEHAYSVLDNQEQARQPAMPATHDNRAHRKRKGGR